MSSSPKVHGMTMGEADLYAVHVDPEQRYSSVVVMTKRRSVEGGDAARHSSSIAQANFVNCASVMQSVNGRVGPMKCLSLFSVTFLSSSL